MRQRDLPDRYAVISELGSGGMGVVYLAADTVLNRNVAVKILSKPVAEADPVSVRRFQREARAAGNLEHENIVRILDFGVNENEQPYLVMEHFDGITLKEMIAKAGRLPLETALEIFAQVCRAIAHTHENGILHRDLKSSNILVGQEDTGILQVKLIDFGIACFTEQTDTHPRVTTGNAILGSPFYMSPEQARGENADERSDIYSLGCVIFEALTGSVPLSGETALDTMNMKVTSTAPGLNERLGQELFTEQIEALVSRCLEKDPELRFQSVGEISEAIRLIADSPYREPGSVSETEPASPGMRLRTPPVLIGLLAAGAGAALLLAHLSGDLSARRGTPLPRSVPDSTGRDVINNNEALIMGRREISLAELKKSLSTRPESVNVENAKITNEILDTIAAYPACKSADFRSSNFDDTARLSVLKSLQSICLDDTNLDEKGIKAIASLSGLRNFQAGHTSIEKDDLKHLSGLKSLLKIQVDGTGITDDSLAHLRGLENLQELHLRDTAITAIGLNSLLKLKRLREIDLSHCSRLAEADVGAFQRSRPDCHVIRDKRRRWDTDQTHSAVEDLL